MNCPNCNKDLKEKGFSIEAINLYVYNEYENKYILEDVSLLPNDSSQIICNNCFTEIDIQLNDLDANILI